MMQREHESPPPGLSASTGMSKHSLDGASKSSLGEVWSPSGSLRRETKSVYVSIAMSVGECSECG